MDTQTYAEELIRRGNRAISWVVNQLDADGNVPTKDLGCSYKCVYPLRISGHSIEASKMLNGIMARHLTSSCDLRDSEERKTAGTYTSCFSQVYPNGWIALGAYWLNRLDAFRCLMQGIMNAYYNEDMGSLRCSCNPVVDEYDVTSAAMAVELFLLVDIDKARRAGEFLLRLVEAQPEPKQYFYGRLDTSFRCMVPPDPRSETYSHIKIGEENQALWFVGMPAAVLILLYQSTGDKRYLDGAVRYFDIYRSCGDAVYRACSSGKAFWAASMLYRITGEASYLNVMRGITDFFFSLQQEEGYFLPPGMVPGGQGGEKVLFDATPEYARWFFEAAAEIHGRRVGSGG